MLTQNIATEPEQKTDYGNTIRIVLPFKDQKVANAVLKQLHGLSSNTIAVTLQPICKKWLILGVGTCNTRQ